MFKKFLATALLVCSLPVMANASWLLNTWAKTAGGSVKVGNGAAQSSVDGNIFKSYTTSAAVPVVVTAGANSTILKVTVNGVDTLSPVSPFNTTVTGPTAQSVFATFKADALAVGASVTGVGGIATPAAYGNLAIGQKLAAPLKFSFIPKAGYGVQAISGTAGFTVSSALPAAVGTVVTVTIPAGTTLSGPVALVGSFSSTALIASAGTVKTVIVNTPVSLTGTTVNGTAVFQKWSSVSRPAGAAVIPTSNVNPTTFTPAVKGTFQFLYRIGTGPQAASQLTVNVTQVLTDAARNQCVNCHNSNNVGSGAALVVLSNWSASGHKANAHGPKMCDGCHGGANSGAHPGALACASCHGATVAHTAKVTGGATLSGTVTPFNAQTSGLNTCAVCHPATVGGDAHDKEQGCIDCHAVTLNAGGAYVQDNSGVRSIMGEFTKRSHHITGATPTNAQCIVCHMEGKGSAYGVHIDATYHMKDNKIYLRDADTNTAIVWSGTEHTNMDNFCFSCHDSNGAAGFATSSATLVPGTALMSATNPFGDTLTNSYDLVARAGVVDVKTAFTTTNASHHAVSGQRYKYRFSTVANAEDWATRTGNPVPAASEIAEGHTDLDGNPIPWTGLTYEPEGPEEGGEATLYEAGKFVSTYIPLGATKNVGDNSTLHCGDCHTVGQWRVGSSTNADGSTTSVAIGAHGSANEYLLRNSEGTDAIHNGRTYVCFNCHGASQETSTAALWNVLVAEGHINASTAVTTSYTNSNGLNPVVVPQNISATPVPSWKAGWNALHPTVIPGAIHGYATAHAVSSMHIQCEADSADNITSVPNKGFNNFSSNRLQRAWAPQSVKVLDYLPAAGATAAAPLGGSNASYGNITGISCTNCHNSGLRSGFGGIHGGNTTYTDGLGRTQKSYRFMPGMGNYRYAPPGGWDGKDVSDPTLLTATNPLQNNGPANGSGSAGYPGASGKPLGGCYTNGGTTAAGDLNNSGGVTYGVCNHHGTSTTAVVGATSVGVPKTTVTGNTANFRANYGGGTSSSPTAYEPTVREATAGGTLVTRPLKY